MRVRSVRRSASAFLASALAAALVYGCGSHSSSHAAFVSTAPGSVGSWSARFLGSQPYSSLYVEIAYVSSEQPDPLAVSLLQQRLSERCNKPGGVTVALGQSFTATQTVYSIADLQNLETQHPKKFASGTQAAAFFLYVNGQSDRDNATSKTPGVTYSGTSVAVFKDTIPFGANKIVSPSEVEQSIVVHEAGHLLGLVNIGAPLTSDHYDAAHPPHCTNMNCVMFWEVESTNATVLLANGGMIPNDYDTACIADLRANGGR